jgi:hypothetical protein
VQAASFAYLGKSAAKLTHAEAALLAVLPQAPSRNRPDRHPERARTARDKVMQRLVAQGVWPEQVWLEGRIEPVLARGHFTPMEAPLFARLAADNQAGALVHTTIDGDLQRWLEGGWRAISVASRADLSGVAPGRQQNHGGARLCGQRRVWQSAPPRLPRHGAGDPLPAPPSSPSSTVWPWTRVGALGLPALRCAKAGLGLSTRQFLRCLSGR